MAIKALEIEDLRCLEHVLWEPAVGLNVVIGKNGAGKTSLLEGLALVATSRALRPGGARGAIRHGAERLRVRSEFGSALKAGVVGYERGVTARTWMMNHEVVRSPLVVYEQIPLLILSPETHYATLQDPQVRRAAVYWLLFHVEPLFLETWRRYQRILRQRNIALKNNDPTYRMFDPGLVQAGETLGAFWGRAQERLQGLFQENAERLRLGLRPETVLKSGWREGPLNAALDESRSGDERLGYTQIGPHRADIQFLLDGRALQQVASHGQQKVVVSAWRLALAQAARIAGKEPILVVDDLAAELDQERRAAFYEALIAYGFQALVTAIETEPLPSSASVFHVEHGQLRAP
ncbi:MAG: DNA replication/repair protein RecF [Acidiferrobacter sp.]